MVYYYTIIIPYNAQSFAQYRFWKPEEQRDLGFRPPDSATGVLEPAAMKENRHWLGDDDDDDDDLPRHINNFLLQKSQNSGEKERKRNFLTFSSWCFLSDSVARGAKKSFVLCMLDNNNRMAGLEQESSWSMI